MAEVLSLGCEHYRRKCSFVAPCCQNVYVCRLCHDDKEKHAINRRDVKEVRCLKCDKRQQVQEKCSGCGIQFGNYTCMVCRLFDDEDKQQFHCTPCGICRVGGRENYFHCNRCDMCLSNLMKDNHKCVEKSSRSNCPVCLEDLHTSRLPSQVSPCGHLIHRPYFTPDKETVHTYKERNLSWLEKNTVGTCTQASSNCYIELLKTGHYACPICNQSMLDMANAWGMLDHEIDMTPMPEEYRTVQVQILCRDCHKESKVLFHVLGLKCQNCGSYNTCRTADPEQESIRQSDSSNSTENESEAVEGATGTSATGTSETDSAADTVD